MPVETDFGVVIKFDGKRWASVEIPIAYSNCVNGAYFKEKMQ